MDVLIVEPENVPRMASITGDLNSLQQVVGGYIEAVYPMMTRLPLFVMKRANSLASPLSENLRTTTLSQEPSSSVGLAKRILIPSHQNWPRSTARNLLILRSS